MDPPNGFQTSNTTVGSKPQRTICFHEGTIKELAFMNEIIWFFNFLKKWLHMITFSISGNKLGGDQTLKHSGRLDPRGRLHCF